MADESSTNAVLDQEAEEPSEESLPSTETSSSEKDGEKKATEKSPAKGKSSQEPLPPDDSKDDEEPKDGIVNIHAHRRIKTERNELRSKLNDLSDFGITSREDAETLLKEAETEAKRKGVQELGAWIHGNVPKFLDGLAKNRPDVYRTIAESGVRDFAAAIASTNQELADQIVAVASEYFGNGAKSGRRVSESPEQDSVSQERTEIHTEKQQLFMTQANSEYVASFDSKLRELTKGLRFQSEEQRDGFFEEVRHEVSKALDRNEAFTRQWDRLCDVRALNPGQLRERSREAVALHMKYATDDLIRRQIGNEKTRKKFGVVAAEKAPDKNGERREVNADGAAPKGKGLGPDANRKKYQDLQKAGLSGHRLEEAFADYLYGV